jgi:hypothetical protein
LTRESKTIQSNNWSTELAQTMQFGGRLHGPPNGGVDMLLEILRIGFAFGAMGLIIWFWYWFMESVGTF